jgi:hypothetical protein
MPPLLVPEQSFGFVPVLLILALWAALLDPDFEGLAGDGIVRDRA